MVHYTVVLAQFWTHTHTTTTLYISKLATTVWSFPASQSPRTLVHSSSENLQVSIALQTCRFQDFLGLHLLRSSVGWNFHASWGILVSDIHCDQNQASCRLVVYFLNSDSTETSSSVCYLCNWMWIINLIKCSLTTSDSFESSVTPILSFWLTN